MLKDYPVKSYKCQRQRISLEMNFLAGKTLHGIMVLLLVETKAFTPPWINHGGFTLLAKRLLNNVDVDFDFHEFDDSFVQNRWLMPSIIERALLHQEAVNPFDLLDRLDMSSLERTDALNALRSHDGLISVPVLTEFECSKLRKFVVQEIKDDGIDNVDGCPDWQVNISEKKLSKIIGKHAVDRLYQLPFRLDPHSFTPSRVGIFIRMYQTNRRPWMPFHRDDNQWTVNVALNSDCEFKGGRLMALHGEKLQIVERKEGDATCHKGSVFHAVSSMREGIRYSMIMFFHNE